MIGKSKVFVRCLSISIMLLVAMLAIAPRAEAQPQPTLGSIAAQYGIATPTLPPQRSIQDIASLRTISERTSELSGRHRSELAWLTSPSNPNSFGSLYEAIQRSSATSAEKSAQTAVVNAAYRDAERQLKARQAQETQQLAAMPLPSGAGSPTAGAGGAAGAGGDAGGRPVVRTGTAPATAEGVIDGCSGAFQQAEAQGVALSVARAATIFDRTIRNVSAQAAIDAAMCIDRLMDKINEVTTAITSIINSLNNPIVAIVTTIATQLLMQIVQQFLDNVVNAVCNAADDIFQAIDNRLKNALCIKGSANSIDPFRFDIDIKAMQCDGWSIDLLSGQVLGDPIPGLNVNWNEVRQSAGGGG